MQGVIRQHKAPFSPRVNFGTTWIAAWPCCYLVPINGSWLMNKELLGLTMAIPRKMDSILFERPPLILKKVEQFSLVCSTACLFASFYNSWAVANGLAIWSDKMVVRKKKPLTGCQFGAWSYGNNYGNLRDTWKWNTLCLSEEDPSRIGRWSELMSRYSGILNLSGYLIHEMSGHGIL